MSANNTPVSELLGISIEKIKEMADVNAIIGEPIKLPDGTTIIPVSKVSYGFASGGSDLPPKTNTQKDFFAGGSGAGVSIQPVAFLVVNNGQVKMLNMEFDGAVDRVISMVPDIADKVGELFKKMSKKKDKDDDSVSVKDEEPSAAKAQKKKADIDITDENSDEAADVD